MKTSTKKLALAEDLELPLSVVTGTMAILGIKGSGKSHTGTVAAEEMLAAGQQIVVIDPTGAWWGLRSSKNGKQSGFPVVVLGGHHGDADLTHGHAVASVAFNSRTSMVLDLSTLNKTQQAVFIGQFLEELYRLMDGSKVLHLFADEAHMYAPQGARGEKTTSAGAMEAVVSRGRIKGIGVTMICQRPQKLNKDVLTQADTLVCMRLAHPRDIAAVKEWVETHTDPADAKEMIKSLPSRETGEAWVWNPLLGIFADVLIRDRTTFDSGRTPEPGVPLVQPEQLADVDIADLKYQLELAEVPRLADAGKPSRGDSDEVRLLKEEIGRLSKMLQEKGALSLQQFEKLDSYFHNLQGIRESIGVLYDQVDFELQSVEQLHKDLAPAEKPPSLKKVPRKLKKRPAKTPQIDSKGAGTPTGPQKDEGDALGRCERAILDVLARYSEGWDEGLVESRTAHQIAIEAGYSPNSGGFNSALARLRELEYVTGAGTSLMITRAGERHALATGPSSAAPADDLLEYWKGKLNKCEGAILDVLRRRAHSKKRIGREAIAELAGYSYNSGGFNSAVARLRKLGLIHGDKLFAIDEALS